MSDWLIEWFNKKQWGTHSETEHHLHLASLWMVPEHYLHWLVVFPQESTGKPENKPASLSFFLSPHLPLCITLSVSLLLLLSQGQRWALTSQCQVFAYKESAFFLYMWASRVWYGVLYKYFHMLILFFRNMCTCVDRRTNFCLQLSANVLLCINVLKTLKKVQISFFLLIICWRRQRFLPTC